MRSLDSEHMAGSGTRSSPNPKGLLYGISLAGLSGASFVVLTAEVQLERLSELTQRRRDNWELYHQALAPLEARGLLRRPYVPPGAVHNAHIYYVVCASPALQERLLSGLKSQGISATFHFQPLHASPFAIEALRSDPHALPKTLHAANCIVRLPLFADLTRAEAHRIASAALAILS